MAVVRTTGFVAATQQKAHAQTCGSELAHEDGVSAAKDVADVPPFREQARSHMELRLIQ
jgi:hypothetical protein